MASSKNEGSTTRHEALVDIVDVRGDNLLVNYAGTTGLREDAFTTPASSFLFYEVRHNSPLAKQGWPARSTECSTTAAAFNVMKQMKRNCKCASSRSFREYSDDVQCHLQPLLPMDAPTVHDI